MVDFFQFHCPDIFYYQSIGKSYEGRDIWMVKISDNVRTDENEPEILFTGGIHGDEKPGYQVVVYTIKAMMENYTHPNVNQELTQRIRNIINETEIYFIPIINPDGVVAVNRKNQRPNNCIFGKNKYIGVDLARNFDYQWEDFNKHPFKYTIIPLIKIGGQTTVRFPIFDFQSMIGEGVYRGPHPFSEKETQAIKEFVEEREIIIGLDYHSYGSLIGYPWAWTKDPPPDEQQFKSIAQEISSINGYDILQWSEKYYLGSHFNDWMYGKQGIIFFTIEIAPTEADKSTKSTNIELIEDICPIHLMVNLFVAEKAIEFF